MSKSKQLPHRDFTYHPELTVWINGKEDSILDAPCFGKLSEVKGLHKFIYHCHDLVSTKLGSTEKADEFLKEFEEYCVYKHLKDFISISVDLEHNPERYFRAINIEVDATKVTYEQWLFIASVLRAFQECPGNITSYLEVKKALPEKSFLFNWIVTQWADSIEYPTKSFKTIGKDELNPSQSRLTGHGLLSTSTLSKFPEEINEKLLIDRIEDMSNQFYMSELTRDRVNIPNVWGKVYDSLGWVSKMNVYGVLIPATKENIDLILEGKLDVQ